MNLDWIVAIVTFLILVIFSFTYYTGFFVYESDLGMSADLISLRVLDNLMVDTYTMPVHYASAGPQTDVPLYMDFSWPAGTKESTKILLSSVEQLCYIDGDTIYWECDLEDGDNGFEMVFYDLTVPMNCQDIFPRDSPLQATPWSMEKGEVVSETKMTVLSLMDYNTYRNSLSISRDFRIEASNGFSYGPLSPLNINVYAYNRNTTIVETGLPIEVRVLVW